MVTVPRHAVSITEDTIARALGGIDVAEDGFGGSVLSVTSTALTDAIHAEPHDLWRVTVLCDAPPPFDALEQVTSGLAQRGIAVSPQTEVVAPRDWLQTSYDRLPPVRVGRFLVLGRHDSGLAKHGTRLVVDAGPAFGTGNHESTRGCLVAIDRLARRRNSVRRVADIGTGSGILAMAMVATWRCQAVAVDIDGQAIRFARETARHNRMADRIRFIVGAGGRGRTLRLGVPFDVVAANILARPLVQLAGELVALASTDGHIILSGLLRQQENDVLTAYRSHGAVLTERIRLGPWSTLVLRRRRIRRPDRKPVLQTETAPSGWSGSFTIPDGPGSRRGGQFRRACLRR